MSVWVGGLVAIASVTRIARRQLEPPDQVDFFRDIGRSFGAVAALALICALAGGATMVDADAWDEATTLAGAGIAAALTIATAAGVTQARRMTRLRERAARDPDDDALADLVRRCAARALALRTAIGALTLALLLVAALLVSG
jgi:hypothetical protein